MQKSITFKNATISFTDTGKGTAVVFLHGFLENKKMWQDIRPHFSDRYRVICIDLLGHGNSDCLGYVHSMDLFSDAVLAVLKALRLRKYFVIGHSLGGYVALAIANKKATNIKGLCLMNSTSNADSEERIKIRERANKMIRNNFENIIKISVTNLFFQENLDKYKEQIEEVKKAALKTSLQGYIAAQEGMKIRPNRNHVLIQNNFKKLIIIGEKDPIINVESVINEAQKTNANYIVLEGGHMSHIENKDALIDAFIKFLKPVKF